MNKLPTDRLDLLILLSKELEDVSFDSGKMIGKLSASSTYTVDEINSALNATGLYRFSDGNEFEINILGNFYPEFSDYLKKPERRILAKVPERFYIHEFSYFCENKDFSSAPEDVKNFYNIATLYDSLCEISDYLTTNLNGFSCVFYFKEQVEITNKYNVSELVSINNLDCFVSEFISDKIHKEQKRGIVRNVIFEMYNNKVDVSTIAKDFDIFFKKVRDGYELYVSEFSFESFKNELDDLKRDYILKINKIFTDVQNQVLAIPLATIVATSQMKKIDNDYSNLLINIFIIFGVFLFSFILKMVLNNQYNSLDLIKDELNFKMLKINNMTPSSHKDNFKRTIKHLVERNEDVESNIKKIQIILYFSILIALVVFAFRFFY